MVHITWILDTLIELSSSTHWVRSLIEVCSAYVRCLPKYAYSQNAQNRSYFAFGKINATFMLRIHFRKCTHWKSLEFSCLKMLFPYLFYFISYIFLLILYLHLWNLFKCRSTSWKIKQIFCSRVFVILKSALFTSCSVDYTNNY